VITPIRWAANHTLQIAAPPKTNGTSDRYVSVGPQTIKLHRITGDKVAPLTDICRSRPNNVFGTPQCPDSHSHGSSNAIYHCPNRNTIPL
jgi:hypothetical protein